jgi:non-heme chloroperoxidase
MLKRAANQHGTPIEAFDQFRAAVLADRSQFWKDLSLPFYGYNRRGSKVSKACVNPCGARERWPACPAAIFASRPSLRPTSPRI